MLTGKQRSTLSALANKEDAIFQIGKNDLTHSFTAAVDEALDKRELVKITVLKSAESTPQEILNELAKRLNAEPVRVIGYKIVLYRKSKKEGVKHVLDILPK